MTKNTKIQAIDRIQQRMIEDRLKSKSLEDELSSLLAAIDADVMIVEENEYIQGVTGQELQVLMLAIAKLALERPGWDWMLGEMADRFDGRALFEQFKDLYYDEAMSE